MNAVATLDIPTVMPVPRQAIPRFHVGEVWFVVLPGDVTVSCVHVEERTRKTVVLRQEPDLDGGRDGTAARYVRRDVRFVERISS